MKKGTVVVVVALAVVVAVLYHSLTPIVGREHFANLERIARSDYSQGIWPRLTWEDSPGHYVVGEIVNGGSGLVISQGEIVKMEYCAEVSTHLADKRLITQDEMTSVDRKKQVVEVLLRRDQTLIRAVKPGKVRLYILLTTFFTLKGVVVVNIEVVPSTLSVPGDEPNA